MSAQAVFAAVRTFVEEVKAGGPAKGQAAQAAKPVDVAAQAAAAKAEAESRAQVRQPPPCSCCLSGNPALSARLYVPSVCRKCQSLACLHARERALCPFRAPCAWTGWTCAARKGLLHLGVSHGVAAAQVEAAKRAAAKRAAAEEAAGTASIALTERFAARPADLFACFTDARRVMAFTQAPAEVCPTLLCSLCLA